MSLRKGVRPMRKAPLALAAAATLGLATIAAPAPAEARWGHGGWGPALAGGLLAGAVIGGIASSAYAYGPGYGYYDGYPYGYGYYGGYAPAYYGGYFYVPSYAVVRYLRVVHPEFAYDGRALRHCPPFYDFPFRAPWLAVNRNGARKLAPF